MTQQEERYFNALVKDRAENAKVFGKRSARGIRDILTGIYTNQAHFIYELLQNADDAGAVNARFVLRPDRLIFAHNGTERFTVSNPETETEDGERGALGHINAITSIGNSQKNEAKIGKFGIGFKAVFQYTDTPRIYDSNVFFQITRLVVPEKLDSDYPGRKKTETLFEFPFDAGKISQEEAFAEIAEKLRTLHFPVLFLSNLKRIAFEADGVSGEYSKEQLQKRTFQDEQGETVAELWELVSQQGENAVRERLWLFSRFDESARAYSVGFFLNDEGKLRKSEEPAFCFFPTKEMTGLHFIIHAPFLLTGNREGIQAGAKHNKVMVELLASLAADSLSYLRDIGADSSVRLIDDNILSLIPTDEGAFANIKDRISFKPFYAAVKQKLLTDKLLPTKFGYTTSSHAYCADSLEIMKLFTNEHLKRMVQDPDAHWVFVTRSYSGEKAAYRDKLLKLRPRIGENDIFNGRSADRPYGYLELVNGIDAEFIERQPVSWLHKFYQWVSESDSRKREALESPVFLSKAGKARPAFEWSNPVLFLPSDDMPDMPPENIVHPALLENERTAAFLESIGVTEPNKRDYIDKVILSQYRNGAAVDTEAHFKLFFAYYRECPRTETDSFISQIKPYSFVNCVHATEEKIYWGRASTLYCPVKDLTEYFASKPDTWFVNFDGYIKLLGEDKRKDLESFLSKLGVKSAVSVDTVSLGYGDSAPIPQVRFNYDYFDGNRWSDNCYFYQNFQIPRLDGLPEILKAITSQQSREKSLILWRTLLHLSAPRPDGKTLAEILTGTMERKPRGPGYKYRHATFDSPDMVSLRQKPWLMNKDGKFLPPCKMTLEELSPEYDRKHPCVAELVDFLQFQRHIEPPVLPDNTRFLTKKQKEYFEIGKELAKAGISLEEAKQLIEERKKAEERKKSRERNPDADSRQRREARWDTEDDDGTDAEEERTIAPSVRRTRREVLRRTSGVPRIPKEPTPQNQDAADWDEYSRPPADYAKKLEREKEKTARELDRIAYLQELQDKALDMEEYSFGWFKALLELEELSGEENSLNSREISIRFGRVELEPGTVRTLELSQPNRGIPRFMEDISNIPLVLHMDSGQKRLEIEVASIRGYTLRVKLKSGAELGGIDLASVQEASIDARNPAFLLKEWRSEFERLALRDTDNLRDNLCKNIRFIFGPPGTGKTTYLANAILLPFMREKERLRVLVLTPTNKAADVLTARIMESMADDLSWRDWLIRFGATQDESIELGGAYREKNFDIRNLSHSVTITTIDRFPYDYFMTGSGERLTLSGLRWDYIIFDEASMIPLFKMIYPLYKKTPREFIIAGDPFQIGPVASVSLWNDENIYTMTKLQSFDHPETVPHPYPVETLTTQYRSVPEIGELFSRLSYGGILKHHRASGERGDLGLDDVFKMEAVNVIKFPVSQYESVYRAKKLENSPYQIYSALFAYEFVSFLASRIHEAKKDGRFRIGIITPYRAQADLIEKLLLSSETPDTVEVTAGTIHTFQGDECDILLALFNPPPVISASGKIFLNRRNIINVSISRARDYLFLLMPDERTENVENLKAILTLEELIKEQAAWREYGSAALEKMMFRNERFIEENTFSTSHQNVNVYETPEKRYEVRSEDSAVDIQKRYKNRPGSAAQKR